MDGSKKTKKKSKDDDDDDDDFIGEDSPFHVALISRFGTARGLPMMTSPLYGHIPVGEDLFPSKVFHFYVGHTNFDITPSIRDTLKTVVGVETLDIMTRYRFRVGIGIAFIPSEIQKTIEEILCTEKVNIEMGENFVEVSEETLTKIEAAPKQKTWLALVAPNGNIEVASTDEVDDEFRENVRILKSIKDNFHGSIVTSWSG